MNHLCIKCKQEKPIECFLKEKTKRGYGNRCKECVAQYQKEWWENHSEDQHQKAQARYEANKEPYLKRSREQKKRNPKAYKEYLKKWREENRDYLNQQTLHRLKTDPIFKLKHRLRGQLRKALKGHSKTNSVLKYIGCDVDFLKGWLEAKFTPDMSWSNHGKVWHIDHKIPCRSFDFSKEEEIKKCFNYTNLQPMIASENCSKQDRLPSGLFARNILTL